MGIVARVRCDELSSAPLQSRPVSARYYLVASEFLRDKPLSADNRRRLPRDGGIAWLRGHMAMASSVM